MRSLRVNYLLEDTALFGGVKVPLHHANLMLRRGHDVQVISRGTRPTWYRVETPFHTVSEFDADTVPEADLHVATYWTTIVPAMHLPTGQAVHYCQGFEASYTHNQDEHLQILDAYAQPLPAFVVSPHLTGLIQERFGRPARVVRPALEGIWRSRRRRKPSSRPRILVMGPLEIDWKGVATALEAIRLLRADGFQARLVRVSQWPLTDSERKIVAPDEFHCHLRPIEVARLVAGCDLLLAPSWEQEGFGLPVLEAMACGVPVVASRIASFTGFTRGAAALASVDQAEEYAEIARDVLTDDRRWRQMRRSGLEVARSFAEARVAPSVEKQSRWVVSGEWRQHR